MKKQGNSAAYYTTINVDAKDIRKVVRSVRRAGPIDMGILTEARKLVGNYAKK